MRRRSDRTKSQQELPHGTPASHEQTAAEKKSRRRSATQEKKEPTVAETSSQLDQALRDGGREQREHAIPRPDPEEEPVLAPDVQRIVTKLFDVDDLNEIADELEQVLRGMRPSRAEYGKLVDALDDAQENARRAMVLHVNAKLAVQQYDADALIVESGMRDWATAVLQKEKDEKRRSKTITDADVVSVMAQNFPDEYQAIARARSRAKLTLDYLSDLCDRLRERARDLRAMVSTSRSV